MTNLLSLTAPTGSLSSFFDSDLWQLIRNFALFFLILCWIACGYWVYKDARRRVEDPWLIATATVLGLVLPFFGAVIYMLVRPPEYLEEVRERRLEIKEMESRLGKREARCPVCQVEIERSYVVCPVCTTRLKQPCVKCKAPLEPLWQICPYCETPVAPSSDVGEDTWENTPRLRKSH